MPKHRFFTMRRILSNIFRISIWKIKRNALILCYKIEETTISPRRSTIGKLINYFWNTETSLAAQWRASSPSRGRRNCPEDYKGRRALKSCHSEFHHLSPVWFFITEDASQPWKRDASSDFSYGFQCHKPQFRRILTGQKQNPVELLTCFFIIAPFWAVNGCNFASSIPLHTHNTQTPFIRRPPKFIISQTRFTLPFQSTSNP